MFHAGFRMFAAGGNGALGITHPALSLIAFLCLTLFANAAEIIPPRPPNHFNDFAGVVRRDTATQLNRELQQFERDTSTQVVVAIFPRMQSGSSVEDYAVRVAQSWGVGQKGRNNGAVLFVFQETRDIWIATGYGVEGPLPDALCKQIIENEIIPRFRAGDFDAGLTAGTRAIMAAVRGEYRGTGRTAADAQSSAVGGGGSSLLFTLIFVFIIVSMLRRRSRRGMVYGPRGRRGMWMGPGPFIGGGGGWGGGGSSGGGSFSGGGGSFGGGGAGGRW